MKHDQNLPSQGLNIATLATHARAELNAPAGRIAMFFACVFIMTGAHMAYLAIWYAWRGLSVREMATIGLVPILVRLIISPAVAYWADRTGRHRQMMLALSAICIIASIVVAFSSRFWPILVSMLVLSVAWATLHPLGETVAMAAVAASQRPSEADGPTSDGKSSIDYGRMRLWGSLSFMVASLLASALATRHGPGAAMVVAILGNFATFWAVRRLPVPAPEHIRQRPAVSISGARKLLQDGRFGLFLLAAGLVQASHAVLYMFSTLHWHALQFPAMAGSLLWGVSIVAEVSLFAFSAWVLARVPPLRLIALGAAAGVIRWTAMGFDPPAMIVAVLQVLHALTYGATHLGAMHHLTRTVPTELAATAQTIYATVAVGVTTAAAMHVSGAVYQTSGGRAYWLMAALSALSVAAAMFLLKPDRTDVL